LRIAGELYLYAQIYRLDIRYQSVNHKEDIRSIHGSLEEFLRANTKATLRNL
tara:strand:- start:125 stop:280 length:156 start_codon:yes stop_codon:yes gene_type:complete